MISLSQNEIRAECEKALRGAGLPWGFARDGGVMASWLGGMGLMFLGGMNRAVETLAEGPKAGGPAALSAASGPVPAPAYGLILAEEVAASGESWSGQVLAPRYLLAAIAILAREQRTGLVLRRDGRIMAWAKGDEIRAVSDGWDDGEYSLARLDAGSASGADGEDGGSSLPLLAAAPDIVPAVPSACWQKLGTYAKETYVPETEEKRARGAGAGNIDNS